MAESGNSIYRNYCHDYNCYIVTKSDIDITTAASLIGVVILLAVTAFLVALYKKNRIPFFPFSPP